jgi:hypothetical protein
LRVLETLSNPISWAVARSSAIGFCFNSVRFMYWDLLVRLGVQEFLVLEYLIYVRFSRAAQIIIGTHI